MKTTLLHIFFFFAYLILSVSITQAKQLQIVSYNVENLFFPDRDSIFLSDSTLILKEDLEYTPDGVKRWNFTRFHRKIENIARVIVNIGGVDKTDAIGLQEIENAECLRLLCSKLGKNIYDFVHYESPDKRGIDVAFIYNKQRIDTIRTKAIPVKSAKELYTRDILYVCAAIKPTSTQLPPTDTLHFFICHLPSQRGGVAESAWKRQAAKQTLQTAIDSIFLFDEKAKIIVMGDMNGKPKDDLNGLKNQMLSLSNKSQGTYKWHGRWTCLDQFYISAALDTIVNISIYNAAWIQENDEKYLGLKPKRTYNGFKYQNGFSDHLPIVLTLKTNN